MTTSPDAATASATRSSLFGIGGEGLLAKHVLAIGQRPEGPHTMQPIGKWVVYGIDLVVGYQCLVGLMHLVDFVLGSKRSGSAWVSRRHRGTQDPIVRLTRFDKRRGCNSGGAQAADPKRFHRSILRQIGPPFRAPWILSSFDTADGARSDRR